MGENVLSTNFFLETTKLDDGWGAEDKKLRICKQEKHKKQQVSRLSRGNDSSISKCLQAFPRESLNAENSNAALCK